ncbi:aromatic ring-hydroxylating oxygenase subunit alpha [Immundisolibacter cernigliae]|uniref:aromatic ring-hydroxylating oxygenase subunit alpha n=1 Tax=Immundisolibacter cernigliae TaxID=1810504 RepID=UPI00083A0FDA|nr:aromatic ring-hydroxylating dioxygenase subunit alpha [Immundisolibacter cernigliae]
MNKPVEFQAAPAPATYLREDPVHNLFAVDRRIFTDPGLFELELKHIFEGSWLYLAHESQLPRPGDWFTTHMGRQPVVLMRGADGQIRGFINACAHRGAKLCRTARGNAKFLTCPYHGWVYDTQGRNVEVKDHASGAYPPAFAERARDLTALPRLENYRGFLFGSLGADVPTLKEHLAAATGVIDALVDQSPDGLEVLRGSTSYTFRGNWKVHAENGLDGYHVSTVHANYIGMVTRRVTEGTSDPVKSIADDRIMQQASGAYDLGSGHILAWSAVSQPENRPLARQRPRLTEQFGPAKTAWMIDRIRNMLLFPNVFLMDQTSTQIRVFRPIAPDLTEVKIYCLAPRGETPAARQLRVRQFEDFFNATGMATPDDLTEFEASQAGFAGAPSTGPQEYARGATRAQPGADALAAGLGIQPVQSSPSFQDETHLPAIFREWRRLLTMGAGA